mmetsp:Transcript_30627/g.47989  ORF Transcript_30627/g.47989 Transcript_30627/m.47989 type:complete len:106 (-) Transcript_30627:893-1210(-)
MLLFVGVVAVATAVVGIVEGESEEDFDSIPVSIATTVVGTGSLGTGKLLNYSLPLPLHTTDDYYCCCYYCLDETPHCHDRDWKLDPSHRNFPNLHHPWIWWWPGR